MEKMAIMTVMILFALVLATWSFASGWGRGHGRGPGEETDITALSDLKLTDEQAMQIKAFRETHFKDVKPLQDRMREKRKELRTLWLKQTPDQDQINILHREIGDLRDQMHGKITGYRRAIFKILSPEQRDKLRTTIEQRKFNDGPRWGTESRGRP